MSQKISQIAQIQSSDEDIAAFVSKLPGWEAMQYKSFRKWAQYMLSQRNMSVNRLEADFEDGLMLYNLLEILSQKKIGKNVSKAKMRIHSVNNLRVSFEFMQKEGIRLENLGVEDIVDGNLKLVMGLLWTLILKYQIGQISAQGKGDGKGGAKAGSAKNWLLDWLKCIAHYRDVKITNLTTSFQDGMAFNALAHLYNNDVVNYDALNKGNRLQNLQNAFDILESEYGVPKLLDAKDMAGPEDPDEKSVMTYLAACIAAFDKYEKKDRAGGQRTDASKSFAWGPGVELASTAEKAWFVIQAKDSKGNKISKGGDQFKVKIKGPSGLVDASVVDNNNGTYQVVYYPQVAGSHLIDVTLENKPISNSPIIVEAEYNAAHLNVAHYKWSTAYGAGTEIASDAEPSNFTIQAKNKYGNEVTKGGDAFKTQLKAPAGAPEVSPTLVDNQNGTYSVTYQVKAPGDYTGDVTLNGNSIFNSPFNILGEHNTGRDTTTDPKWSEASGQGLVEASTIQQANFTITSKNKYGNSVGKGGDSFDVAINSSGGRKVAHTLKDNNNGTYAVTYQPIVGGNHAVRISLNNTPILKSPYTVPVSQKTDPAKTIAFGAGTETGSTAEPAVFTIQARDGAGNNVNRGGDKVRVAIAHKGTDEVEAEVSDNGDGTYTVSYQPIVPGVHQVEVKINGGQIQKSPFNVKVDFNVDPANVADPKWSVAYGPGVELASTAEVATFTIEARNKYGNTLKDGGDKFDVALKSAAGASDKATVVDNKNGTYSVQYKAATAGQLEVGVSLKGTGIFGSSYRVSVEQNNAAVNEADARWTSAYGPGRHAATTLYPAALTVQAKNKYGNNVNKGGDDVRLRALDTQGKLVDADVKDNGNGTYSASYRPTSSGPHRVDLSLAGSSIHKSPFNIKVTQDTDAKKSKAFGPGIELASTAEPAVFTIQAVDSVGNLVNRGGDNFKVRISGPEHVTAQVTDNNDGTYTVTYKPKSAGDYTITTTLDGTPISNSPIKVKTEQQTNWDDVADPKWSTTYGAGTEIGSTAEQSEFTIQARNKYGNNITKGGHEFNVEFQGGAKGSSPIDKQIKDNEDGTYTVTYQATTPGSYVGDVTLDSKSIHNSPFKVIIEGNTSVHDEADPKWSIAVGEGLNSADTRKVAPFTIYARNRYGNQLTKGGSDFKLRIKGFRGRPVKNTLKDNNDGTYSATYQPTASGKHLLDIKLEGTSISHFPKAVNATQQTDASKTVAKGAGTVTGSTAEVAEFTVQAKDIIGNNCNRGGDKFKVVISPPGGSPPVEAKVKDNSDGTYTVRYAPSVPGVHGIEVSLDGKPISNSPLKANIELNSEPITVVDPKWSTATGPATELTSIAEHSEFTIQAKNKYGNPVTSSPAFAVAIKAPEGSPVVTPVITDNKNGTFLVKYKPFVPGDHSVNVSLNGAGIFETPVTAVAEHNTKFDEVADARWSEASGLGIEQANTSDSAKFNIQAKNRYGNIIRNGGSDFRVNVKSSTGSEVDANIKDNANGTYSVDYQPSASGDHSVEVTLDDWNIYKSPFIVPVSQGTDASKSFAFGAGVELGSTAEPSIFTIQAVDKLGNKVNRGGDNFKTAIVAANNNALVSQTKDNRSGTYSVTYQPTVAGTYTVNVTLAGQNILRSPYKPKIEQNSGVNEVADAKWSCITGPGTEGCSTAEPANFTVIAKNKYGNQLKKGGDVFEVKVQGPANWNGVIQPTIVDNGDGTYSAQYQSKVPGEHQINVTLKGQSIFGCPLKVASEQGTGVNQEASARFSTATGAGLKSATTIAPAEFTVQAKNKFGNNLKKGGNDVKVAVKGPRGSTPISAVVKDNNDGTYSVSYQPNAGGQHTVSVSLDGSLIQDAPFVVPVSQATDASASTVDGAGIQIASTAEPASFVIQARDKLGHKCNRGGDPFKVKIVTPKGSELVTAKVKDNRDGTYTVTYQPKVAGEHEVEVTLEDKPVGQGKYKVKVEHNDSANTITDPQWSFAHGPGVELASTAEPSEFTIQARNKYGNDIKTGGDAFKPAISSQAGTIPFSFVDNQNGTYLVTYQANVPGVTTVAVALNGTAIKGSPYQVSVDKNTSVDTEADSRWTGVIEDGINKANIIEPSEFTIQARNKYGNKVNKGGDDFGVSVKNDAGQVSSKITDNGDGTYSVAYQPLVTGDHLLDISLQGSSINKFPLDVNVTQGTDASKCVPFGPGFESAIVGEPNTFTVQAKDKNWNNVKNGGDAFEASAKGPNGENVPVSVKDNKDGTYAVTYTPTTPGYHDVNVTLDGEAIAYCPFSVPAKQQTAASHTSLSGAGLESATTTEPAIFTIQAKDKTGNNLAMGGDDFYVKVTPPAGSKPVIANVSDNGDGSYTVEYQPNAPGNHTVEVLLNDELVGGKPVIVPVTQFTDPSKTLAYGPGFEDASTGNPAIFMIRAKDGKGNNVLRGGDPFKATLTAPGGAVAAGTIKDNNNGTYVVTFQPTIPGNHVLAITLDGKPISNSPQTISVRQDVDPSKSVISGPGIEKANTVDLATFTIEARDSNGTKVSRGGEKFDVKIVVASNGFPVQSNIKDNKDGTYAVSYQPFAPGKHDISVTLGGKPVGKSPISLNVEAGPATVMTEFEMEVWREINKARMSPSVYAGYLRDVIPNYEPSTGAFTIPNTTFARQTKEGRKALFEAIRALEEMDPVPAIKINETFSYSCRDLIADLGPKGAMGNVMSDGTSPIDRLNRYGRWKGKVTEIINYGGISAKDIVMSWIIDDGSAERPNRHHLFDPEFTVAGVSSGPHMQALRMCVVALAGNYLEGEEPPKPPRIVSVNTETENLSFDRFETKDKSGYLIPVGKTYTDIDKVKVFKEGKTIHIERTILHIEDNEPMVSHFRYNVPFDFDPITVIAKLNSLNTDLSFFITKPAGAIDPNKEVVLTTYSLGPTKGRKNEKMDFKTSENTEGWEFQCVSSSCLEDLTIKLKGKTLSFVSARHIIDEDEEGEFETISTSTRTVNLPFQVALGAFSLQGQGKEGFTLKVTKPTSTVSPDAQIEIPVREGYFDF